MKADDPRHGTTEQGVRAIPGCPCDRCERARAHVRSRRKLRKLGRPARIAATPVAAHIRRLIREGWNQESIGRASGISPSSISEIRRGHYETVARDTAVALLSLKVEGSNPRPWVPSLGTARRLQALQALGWTMRSVCERAGLTARYGSSLCHTGQQFVHVDAAAKIARVYNELSMTPAPDGPAAATARSVARRNGYVPPLAWDDIDDPDEQPDRSVPCGADDCAGAVAYRGLCRRHYEIAKRQRARAAA